MNLLFS